jgi:hypothetical protein
MIVFVATAITPRLDQTKHLFWPELVLRPCVVQVSPDWIAFQE